MGDLSNPKIVSPNQRAEMLAKNETSDARRKPDTGFK
jgi:hypothetical protein